MGEFIDTVYEKCRTEEFINYYRMISSSYKLSDYEINILFMDYRNGDIEAFNKIINNYLKFVVECVLNFSSSIAEEDIVDVIRYGNSVLYKAVISYSDEGILFSKYLFNELNSKIREYIKGGFTHEEIKPPTSEIDDKTFKVLKMKMTNLVYYVFYSIVKGCNVDELAISLGVSKLTINNLYSKGLTIYKKYSRDIDKEYKDLQKKDKLKVNPLCPLDILKFIYLQRYLTSDESYLYYYMVFNKHQYNTLELCNILKISSLRYIELNKGIKSKLELCLTDDFMKFKSEMLLKYGASIYNLIDDSYGKDINYEEIKRICDTLSLDKFYELLGDKKSLLKSGELGLLERYFGKEVNGSCNVENTERDVNLNKFGYKKRRHRVEPQKLYKTYLDNIEEFNSEQRLYLECYYFKVKDKNLFKTQYPETALYYRHYYLIDRLERLHYGIFRMLDNNFNKEKYLSVKENYGDLLIPERVKLLDLFYGVDGRRYTITEIAEMYQMDYIKMHDLISDAREYAINLYANRGNKLTINKSLYIPFLDAKYDYTEETRSILTMFLIDNASYDEISEKTGLTKYRISNIITDGIRKMDSYRLGITEVVEYTKDELEAFFEAYKKSFTDTDREMLMIKLLDKVENKDIALKYGMKLLEFNRLVRKFNILYLRYQIRDVVLDTSDIEDEINRHISESLLSDKQKEIVSYYYGIKSMYNLEGIKLGPTAIQKKFGITVNAFYHSVYDANDKIKARKMGLLKPDCNYISRVELDKLLDDHNLPISVKEREIICYLFGLRNYPVKTIIEIADVYNEGQSSIRRRYYRSIVSIKKYLLGEIEGQLNYEIDIVPIMKYFSDSEKRYMNDFYRDNLTYEQISKKYNLSFEKVIGIMGKIKIKVYDILHDPKAKKFDFDYYKEAILDPRLPFYGDLETAIKIFDLYFGMTENERLGVPEIIKRLNLDIKSSAVSNCINLLMLSVCKLRDGIYKDKEFTLDEIGEYYFRNASHMLSTHIVYYKRYFERLSRNKMLNGNTSRINEYITYDLIRDTMDDCFTIRDATREEVLKILRDEKMRLANKTRLSLMYYFNFSYRDLMNGKEMNHVYRIMDNLIKRRILVLDGGMKLEKKGSQI